MEGEVGWDGEVRLGPMRRCLQTYCIPKCRDGGVGYEAVYALDMVLCKGLSLNQLCPCCLFFFLNRLCELESLAFGAPVDKPPPAAAAGGDRASCLPRP